MAQILSEKDDQRTLEDLGHEFGVSKERIRQVRIEAERKMEKEVKRLTAALELSTQDLFGGY